MPSQPTPRTVTVRVFLTAPKGAPPGTKPKPLKSMEVPLQGRHEHTDGVKRDAQAAAASLAGVQPRDVLVSRAAEGGFVAYAPPPSS